MTLIVTTEKRAVPYNSGSKKLAYTLCFYDALCLYEVQNSKTHFSVFKYQDTEIMLT